jgi:3-oxoacyl-[acyl-carrier protein] reductase
VPTQSRPVAVINDGSFYVGPPLARHLASRGFDLIVGDPADGLLQELERLGARVVGVESVRNLDEEQASLLSNTAMESFGRIDSAVMFSGRVITGSIINSTRQDLDKLYLGCVVAPYNFLKAMLPVMTQQESGQVLIITSATAARPTPGAGLYSSMRAGATMMAKNAASEMTRHNVQVNSVGTNFMDFPEFLRASGANDPERRKLIESQVPLGRLGTVEEFASFCMPFLDGTSTFVTGQFVSFSGGWS